MKHIIFIFSLLLSVNAFGAALGIDCSGNKKMEQLVANLDTNNDDSVATYLRALCADDELNPFVLQHLKKGDIEVVTIFYESLLEAAALHNAQANVVALLDIDFSSMFAELGGEIDLRPFYFNGLVCAFRAPACEQNLKIIEMIATKYPKARELFINNPLEIIAETSLEQKSPMSRSNKSEEYRIEVARILLDAGFITPLSSGTLIGTGLIRLEEFVRSYQPTAPVQGASSTTA